MTNSMAARADTENVKTGLDVKKPESRLNRPLAKYMSNLAGYLGVPVIVEATLEGTEPDNVHALVKVMAVSNLAPKNRPWLIMELYWNGAIFVRRHDWVTPEKLGVTRIAAELPVTATLPFNSWSDFLEWFRRDVIAPQSPERFISAEDLLLEAAYREAGM
jgi:hypothetical protein